MVFSSLPLYLDPPNWQQHTNDQQQHHQHQHQLQGSSIGAVNESQHHHYHQHQHQLIIPSQQVPQPLGSNVQPHQVGLGGTPIRPNSMAERARAAKIPPPETPLKCPRCASSNTKFCYFNNYSLTQPRHFCKACRRYWTNGGALRNVPVGGGCRRNKRPSSKSSGGGGATSSSSSRSSLSSPSSAAIGGGGAMDNIISSTIMGPTIPGLSSGGGGMTSFMASLQSMANLGIGNLGLTFGGLHAPSGAQQLGVGGLHPHMDFNNNDQMMMSQQQHQQAQFSNNLLGGFEMGVGGSTPSGSLYSTAFQGVSGSSGGGGGDDGDDQHQVNEVNVLNKGCSSTAMMLSQLAPVKMEASGQGLNLAKQLMMGISSSSNNNNVGGGNGNQFWGCPIPNANTIGGTITTMWTDVSGLNSSSMN